MEATSNPYQTPTSNMDAMSGNTAHTKPISMSGRISRMRYMAWSLVLGLIFAAIALVGGGLGAIFSSSTGVGDFENNSSFPVVMGVLGLLAIPAVILGIGWGRRRLNDANKSGWMLLLFLIPLVNIVMTIYLIAAKGTQGDNNFGPPPPENSTAVKVLGTLYIVFIVLSIVGNIATGFMAASMQGGGY